MRDFIFIYWDDLPEKDYNELQNIRQDEVLYGSYYHDDHLHDYLTKAREDEDSSTNNKQKIL